MTLVPVYRRRPSALHAARASVATAYCGALAAAALVLSHPLALAAVGCAVVLAGVLAGVGRDLARAGRLAVPFALVVMVVNALVSQRGVTVVLRGGTVLGHRLDITAEALAWGAITALRLIVVFAAFALHAAVVDPDELLRLVRRFSYRSALTASLATRLVPVLARDATRMSDAARCRPAPPGRLELARATFAGALDRAVDVAAALEVRGYATARAPRSARRPWSRHDTRVLVATALVAATVTWALAGGVGHVQTDPVVRLALGPDVLALAALLLLAGVLPFLGSRARLGVARG